MTHGALRVQQPNATAPAETHLTPIGSGILGLVEPDIADPTSAWVESGDPVIGFGLGAAGAWLRVAGTDYRILGQSDDGRQLLLDDAAGSVGSGDPFVGVYKLDAVTLLGGAVLRIEDENEIGTVDLDGSSQLIRP
jgi:hypothetical protein